MSNEERARILRMVVEGKVSAEEAADLLEALEPARAEYPRMAPPAVLPPALPGPSRVLHVEVWEAGDSKVNIRIPLGLVRAAGRFIPRIAQRHLAEYDIDLEQMVADLGNVMIDGPLIEVHDADSKVIIAME